MDIRVGPRQSREEAWCENAVAFLSDAVIKRLSENPTLSDRDTWDLVRAVAPDEAARIEAEIGPPPWIVQEVSK